MNIIRFSILLSLLLFGIYTNHRAEKNNTARVLNDMRLEKLKRGITEENYGVMRSALELHRFVAGTNESGSSASLIVKDGKVVGKGWDKSKQLVDPTAHATVTAVREASKNMGTGSLKGCTLYSTAELCPMCLSLLYITDIDKIIYCIPSGEEASAETLVSEKISGSLRRKIGERAIPEILIPYQELDSASRKVTGNGVY